MKASRGLSSTKLALYLTRGSSLSTWASTGTLMRETAIYRALLPAVAGVKLITWARHGEAALARELPGFQAAGNAWRLPASVYGALLERGLHLPRGPVIIKSNQVPGADSALAAARRRGAPFIARAGYLPSNIMAWREGPGSPASLEMRRLEEKVFSGATMAVVTTSAMAQEVTERYRVPAARLRIIPNFVDTDLFAPGPGEREPGLVVYVGRLHQEKNVTALVEASQGLPGELVLVGEGPLRPALERLIQERSLPVRLAGGLPNHELPALLARASLFVLPSLGEHHPKALLEAMSCAAPVLGCQVPGVRELIQDGVTGRLCGTSAQELRQAMASALAQPGRSARLGQSARQWVIQRFSLPRVQELELALWQELAP